MVAGEASGDLLAALLLGGLRQRWPALQAFGIGGPKMVDQGFDAWWPQHKLAVHGYADALAPLSASCPAFAAGWRRGCCSRRPSAFIGVDAPDFNLGLEAQLRHAGIKAIHFVCPSIWAWRGGRIAAHRAQRGPCAVPVSLRARAVARVPASPPPMSAIRWPM